MMRRRLVTTATSLRFSQNRGQVEGPVESIAPLAAVDDSSAEVLIEDPFSTLGRTIAGGSNPAYVEQRSGRGFADAIARDSSSTLYREALSDFDPFGGLTREDYFRDPLAGYAPRYAPRDFVHSGNLDYTHSLTPTGYTLSVSQRNALDHDVSHFIQDTANVRRALRGGTAADADTHIDAVGKSTQQQLSRTSRKPSPETNFAAAFEDNGVFRATHTAIPGPYDQTQARVSLERNASISGQVIDETELKSREVRQIQLSNEAALTQSFQSIHGLVERDAFEEERAARRALRNFDGYDPTAANARTMIPLPRLVSPSSMDEAQSAVRKNTLDTTATVAQTILAQNTNAAEPKIGEALVADIADAVEATRRDAFNAKENQIKDKFGFGRKGLLVFEGGPDQRPLNLHQNDELLYRAAIFQSHEYGDGQMNEVTRQSITEGVGHLLDNKFDIDRRAHLLAKRRPDPIERAQIHYGVPIKQQVDHRVRYGNGRSTERHHEFFTPHPTAADMQLQSVYDDVIGFPLFRGRTTERFEFDLFQRYRAHHQQRRRIALLNGLEPRADETVAERNIRRAKIDELCERTPFVDSMMSKPTGPTRNRPSVEVLRQWFGAYWLPSPTLASEITGSELNTGLHIVDLDRSKLGFVDRREHLLSSRYINRLLTVDALNNRLLRGYIKDAVTSCPEVEMAFRLKYNILKHFTAEQRRQYDEYVAGQTEKHLALWKDALAQRRRMPGSNESAVAANFFDMEVVTVRSVVDGATMVLSKEFYDSAVAKADPKTGAITIEGVEVVPVSAGASAAPLIRRETFVTVKLEPSGTTQVVTESQWNSFEEEAPSPDPNQHIHGGGIVGRAPYNRSNYVEAQDFLWEQRTAMGVEGWTIALTTDGLTTGKPLLAKRKLDKDRFGEYERAEVVEFVYQPFFNPLRLVEVEFKADGSRQTIPVSQTMVWQLSNDGPDRTLPLETREFHNTIRYIDMADPCNQHDRIMKGTPHFLDKYAPDDRANQAKLKMQRSRDVRTLDAFRTNDYVRSENHRLLSAAHRKDYVRQRYFHRFTPWEYIVLQASEAPLIEEQIRRDNVGPAYFHAPNRFWTNKRRAFGEIKNFYNETRDFLQYVDGVVGWDKAKKIRTLWEVRQHHPTPLYNRPGLAMHRNSAALLPAHLWEADKKTGSVKSLKDTIRGYRPTVETPAWAADEK